MYVDASLFMINNNVDSVDLSYAYDCQIYILERNLATTETHHTRP